jgi:hypothetical protein
MPGDLRAAGAGTLHSRRRLTRSAASPSRCLPLGVEDADAQAMERAIRGLRLNHVDDRQLGMRCEPRGHRLAELPTRLVHRRAEHLHTIERLCVRRLRSIGSCRRHHADDSTTRVESATPRPRTPRTSNPTSARSNGHIVEIQLHVTRRPHGRETSTRSERRSSGPMTSRGTTPTWPRRNREER